MSEHEVLNGVKNCTANIDTLDLMELGSHIFGLSEDDWLDELEEVLWDKWEMSIEQFQKVVNHLLPLANLLKSELTGDVYHCFAKRIDGGQFESLVKMKHPK